MSKPCSFFLAGYCKHGPACRFSHDSPTKQAYGSFTVGKSQAAGGPARGEGRGQQGRKQRPRAQHVQPAHVTRTWWTTTPPAAAAGPCFRVMSYNVLADELAQTHRAELYRSTHPDLLAWGRRWSMIQQEIQHLHPDIVCLQEVDHWGEVQACMSQLGYEGRYAQRSGGRMDGCATFWRPSCFQSVAISQLDFSNFDMRDNVGLITLLQHTQQQQQFNTIGSRNDGVASAAGALIAVANTHILFNPKRGDVKVGQLRLLIQHLQQLVADAAPAAAVAGGVPALVMGDMNHMPHTPIYQFMRQGWLDCLRQHRKDLAGTGSSRNVLRTTYGMRRSHSYAGRNAPVQQQQFMHMQQQHSLSSAQHPPPMQQFGLQLPPQLPLHSNPGRSFGEVRHNLQQQQLVRGGQQQGVGQLHRASSAPALTLRRLKSAGWEPDELVMATGGAHGTHLQHIEQKEQQQPRQFKQQQQQLQASQQQQQVLQFHKQEVVNEACVAELTGSQAGAAAAAVSHSLPQQQQQQHPATHNAVADLSLFSDNGNSVDLKSDQQEWQQPDRPSVNGSGAFGASGTATASNNRYASKVCVQQQRKQQHHHRQGYSDDDMDLSANSGEIAAAGCAASRPSAWDTDPKPKKTKNNSSSVFMEDGTIGTSSCGGRALPSHQLQHQQHASNTILLQQQQQQHQYSGGYTALPSVLKSAGMRGRGRELWDEPLPTVVGDGIARHSLMLRSCYAEVLGSEPEYTSCHDSFYGTVDYIWYTPEAGQQHLKPIAVLLPPAVEEHVLPTACMPNRTLPSDHISLVCDFALRSIK